jgi:hypothetical protein
MPGPAPPTTSPALFVTTTLPLSFHRFGMIVDAGVTLPMSVFVPPMPFVQEHVIETEPSVSEPVKCFGFGPSPCHVPSMNAKLAVTESCDAIVNVWFGALELLGLWDLRLKTTPSNDGPSKLGGDGLVGMPGSADVPCLYPPR